MSADSLLATFSLDSAQAWVTFVTSATALFFGLVQFIRHRILKPLRLKWEQVQEALDQLKPNGGESLSDVIRKMSHGMTLLRARVFGVIDMDKTPVYEFDQTGACTFANRALCDLFGIDKSAMLGNGWIRGVDFNERDETYREWMSSVTDRRPYDCAYTVVNQRTGQRYKVKTHADPIIVDGDIAAYRGWIEHEEAA